MCKSYEAEVEIVLVGYENIIEAERELEERMAGIDFTKTRSYYRGHTPLLPPQLEEFIRGYLTGKLTYSDDRFLVRVLREGEQITRTEI